MFMLSRGFAHCFSVLSDKMSFLYKCDNVYHKSAAVGIRFNDPSINIDLAILLESTILSEKDKSLPFWIISLKIIFCLNEYIKKGRVFA